MRHYRQSAKRNCGQIAVAALTEKTVEEIEALVGHSHGTKTKELVSILRSLGYGCPDRAIPEKRLLQIPDFGLAQVHNPNRAGWHWVAFGEGLIFDGLHTRPFTRPEYERLLGFDGDGARITSYVPVHKVDGLTNAQIAEAFRVPVSTFAAGTDGRE